MLWYLRAGLLTALLLGVAGFPEAGDAQPRVWHDPTGQAAAPEAAQAPFVEAEGADLFLPHSHGRYWIQLRVENPGTSPLQRVVSIDYPHVLEMSIYAVDGVEPVPLRTTGAEMPLSARPILGLTPALDFTVPAGGSAFLLALRLGGHPENHALPVEDPGAFASRTFLSASLYGLLLGGVLVLFLYNLALSRSLSSKRHLYYCLLAFWFLGTIVTYDGFLYLLPFRVPVEWATSKAVAIFWAAFAPFPSLFIRSVLELEEKRPRLSRVYLALAAGLPLVSVATILSGVAWFVQLGTLLHLSPFVLALFAGPGLARQGSRAAAFVTAGAAAVVLGALFQTLGSVLLYAPGSLAIPGYGLRNLALYGGFCADMVLSSLALSSFVARVDEEKRAAQDEARQRLEENASLKDSHARELERRTRTGALLEAESAEAQLLDRARQEVLDQLTDSDFDVPALARALGMSRSSLQRHMEAAGTSAGRFIREVRLEQAHAYLEAGTHQTLAETAHAVGFRHAGHFSRLYKRYRAELGEG